jgi:phosphoenolpyruvate synthase/pyruvate phosphate dikinase
MYHAAIVSREYGLPAVVGTGFGTSTIKTGQLVRIDGSRGTVTVRRMSVHMGGGRFTTQQGRQYV